MDTIKQQLFIGIDGGGSKCRATIVDSNGQVLGTAVAGPANPLHGFERSLNSIEQSALLALDDANLCRSQINQLIAGIGLAGVNLPTLFERVNQWQHPFKQMHLTTDLRIACLGAHNGGDGAIMIAGTGSCGFACIQGKETIIGAHGFPHGDMGSGAWIGLEAFKAVLLSLDKIEAQTTLNQKLMEFLGCDSALIMVEKMAGKASSDYAKLAPLVFACAQQGDPIATRIIQQGAAYLDCVAEQLISLGAPKLSLIGGLGDILFPWLSEQTQGYLTDAIAPPETGALLFAQAQTDLLGKSVNQSEYQEKSR